MLFLSSCPSGPVPEELFRNVCRAVRRVPFFGIHHAKGQHPAAPPLPCLFSYSPRIVKEMRNDINRKVNCETANLNKVVGAAVKQLEDINYIEETIGLARLPEQLAEVARVRLEYPDRSLKELGSFLMTPVGKSGVNHRLRKISSIAEALREGKGGIE